MAELTPERLREIESSALEGSNERCSDHATVPILDAYCGKAALAIAKSDEDEAYHQLYCAIVQDLNLSAEEQALRMNQAMGLTGEQSNAVLSMMREAIAQENR